LPSPSISTPMCSRGPAPSGTTVSTRWPSSLVSREPGLVPGPELLARRLGGAPPGHAVVVRVWSEIAQSPSPPRSSCRGTGGSRRRRPRTGRPRGSRGSPHHGHRADHVRPSSRQLTDVAGRMCQPVGSGLRTRRSADSGNRHARDAARWVRTCPCVVAAGSPPG
jgi:hypothetical protein